MNKKILIDAIGFLLIALVVVVGYKLSPLLLPKADVSVFPDVHCDLHHQACGVDLPGGGRVELSFGTRPIPMVKAFRVEVKVSGVEAKLVEVDFAGIDMNMGLNRPQLLPQGGGVFVAELMLPGVSFRHAGRFDGPTDEGVVGCGAGGGRSCGDE